MKTNKTLFIYSVILTLLMNTVSFSQSKTHYITLYVNTSTIDSQNASLVSNFGQEEDISNEDYTISVSIGDTIIWKGVSSTSPEDDVVNIKSINYEGGTNIFDQNILKGNGEDHEEVVGEAVNGSVGDEIKYKISFKVLNNGKRRNGTFHIDPKIQIKN